MFACLQQTVGTVNILPFKRAFYLRIAPVVVLRTVITAGPVLVPSSSSAVPL